MKVCALYSGKSVPFGWLVSGVVVAIRLLLAAAPFCCVCALFCVSVRGAQTLEGWPLECCGWQSAMSKVLSKR
jgi:hypothetical protein